MIVIVNVRVLAIRAKYTIIGLSDGAYIGGIDVIMASLIMSSNPWSDGSYTINRLHFSNNSLLLSAVLIRLPLLFYAHQRLSCCPLLTFPHIRHDSSALKRYKGSASDDP